MILILLLILSYFGSQVFNIPGYIGFSVYLLLIVLLQYLRFKFGADKWILTVAHRLLQLVGLILAILGLYFISHSLHQCTVIDRHCVFGLF